MIWIFALHNFTSFFYFQVKLSVLNINPEMAHLVDERRGVVAAKRGEYVQIEQCENVTDSGRVQLRQVDICYFDLPILFDGKEAFRCAYTYIIKYHSHVVDCTLEFSYHEFDGNTYSQKPEIAIDNIDVTTLKPGMPMDKLGSTLPYDKLGSVYGDTANDVNSAMMLAVERITAER